jgi:hypothetical protein
MRPIPHPRFWKAIIRLWLARHRAQKLEDHCLARLIQANVLNSLPVGWLNHRDDGVWCTTDDDTWISIPINRPNPGGP